MIRRLSAVVLPLLAALPFAPGISRPVPPYQGPESPVELRLSPWAGPLRTVMARAGTNEAPFLFDTGGGATVLSSAMAKAIGCAPFGRGTGFRHDGTRIDGRRAGPIDLTLGAVARRGEVGVLDLDAMFAGMPKIGGIASLETFAGRLLTLDLAHDRLVVETPASCAERTAAMRELTVRIAHQAAGASLDLFVSVQGRHGPLWFELDSGNVAPVLIAPHAWAELGIEPPAAGRSARLELPVTGLDKVPCEAASRELIYDGLLNADFCARFVITMDLERGRAWASAPAK